MPFLLATAAMRSHHPQHHRPALLAGLLLSTFLLGMPSTVKAMSEKPEPPPAPGLILQTHPLVGALVRGEDAHAIDEAALLKSLESADVVILGETHDNPEHHRLQDRLFSALVAGGRKPALVFEQIDRDQQDALTGALVVATETTAAEKRTEAVGALFARGWDWPAYRPLVMQAIEAKLPIYAGNLGRGSLRPLVREGWTIVAEAERQRLAIEAAWNPERDAYMRHVIEESHCNQINETLREGLIRAQRLRDATLADAVLAARAAGNELVVLIAGRGHARKDVGVPRYLMTREPALRVVSLGISEVDKDELEIAAYLKQRADSPGHDYLWLTARFDRPDPCANFGK